MRPRPPSFPDAHLRAESVPRPVSALADYLERGAVIPPHRHERGQLIFSIAGAMTVRSERALWILPPSHALWMPPGITHQIRASGPVEFRSLYVQRAHAKRIGCDCRVVFVSPLLRELIVRAVELPALYDEGGMEGRLMRLLMDEVTRLPAQPLGLRMPSDPRLVKLCERVLADLGTTETIAKLGAAAGLSERSVIRLFRKETGLSFRRWHNQARLLKAFELFHAGRSVTRIALDLGYSGPSAFTKMFRRAMGKAPRAMREVH
jgi:AraC-like DNA-binding protein